MILSGLFGLLTTDPTVAPLLGAQTSVFFSVLPKGALLPAVVIHVVHNPGIGTLDGTTDQADGRFQFDSYANDQPTARKLSKTIKKLLQDYHGALSDGSIIQGTEVNLDQDGNFEAGGTGYIFRAILDVSLFNTEAA